MAEELKLAEAVVRLGEEGQVCMLVSVLERGAGHWAQARAYPF